MFLKYLVTTAIFCATLSECYKILLIFPVASRSHYHLGSALAKGLADVGHDVTIVSPYEEKYKPKNGTYKEILLTGFVEAQNEIKKEMDMFNFDSQEFIAKFRKMMNLGHETAARFFSHEAIKNLLNSNQTFDATIIEHFVTDSLKALPAHFNSHQILLVPMASYAFINHLVGNPSLPSYVPESLLPYSSRMNFWERLSNTMAKGVFSIFFHGYNLPQQKTVLEEHLPKAADDLHDAIYNASLVLVNSHPSLVDALNTVPNMIDIAGYHLKYPKQLPKELQEYLDNSKNGVVYFSMGSVVESKDMPVETRNMILRSLGKLKENVIWKWEEDKLPGQTKNVRIEKWLHQESILAHPNVKLFITHGGFLSTIEATYYGVPVVALPIFGDQKSNAQGIERTGVGKHLAFTDLSEDKLTELIKEVLNNPKYAEIAKHKSALMRDRQVPPLQTAIYWVEYVIRHNGAKHLRVASLDLKWYQYYLFDVIGFLLAILFLSVFIAKKVFRLICCRSKKDTSKKVKLS